MTQEAFARTLNVSLRTVQSWEAGEKQARGLSLRALAGLKNRLTNGRMVGFQERELVVPIRALMKARHCLGIRGGFEDVTGLIDSAVRVIENRLERK
jgi:hypothetical protein